MPVNGDMAEADLALHSSARRIWHDSPSQADTLHWRFDQCETRKQTRWVSIVLVGIIISLTPTRGIGNETLTPTQRTSDAGRSTVTTTDTVGI